MAGGGGAQAGKAKLMSLTRKEFPLLFSAVPRSFFVSASGRAFSSFSSSPSRHPSFPLQRKASPFPPFRSSIVLTLPLHSNSCWIRPRSSFHTSSFLLNEKKPELPPNIGEVIDSLSKANGTNPPVSSPQVSQSVGDTILSSDSIWNIPVNWTMEIYSWIHNFTGLPWWITIIMVTAFFRAATFPLVLLNLKNSLKLASVHPQLMEIQNQIQLAHARGDRETATKHMMKIQKMWKDTGASPFKSIKYLFPQMPIFILNFVSLRMMALKIPSLHDGGIAWFTDLAVADPYYRLPTLAAVGMILSLHLGTEGQPNVNQPKLVKAFMYGMCALSIPFTGHFPQALHLYWSTLSALGILQVFLLRLAIFRKLFGLESITVTPGAPVVPKVTFSSKPSLNPQKMAQKFQKGKKADEIK